MSHQSVMFDEVMATLAVESDGWYIDGTFGRGGHAEGILQRLGPQGRLIVNDLDPEAIEAARLFAAKDSRVEVLSGPYSRIISQLPSGDIGKIRGIFLDLGVSSPQIDQAVRGFSLKHDGPLDMRMDPTQGRTAAEWLNKASQDEIIEVLRTYGQEPYAVAIARAIVQDRALHLFTHTHQLASLVARIKHNSARKKIHPATLVFQAIRIFINQELQHLEAFLPQSYQLLHPGGRLVVLSFHSLEDRMVKQWFQGPSQHASRRIMFDAWSGPEYWSKLRCPKKPSQIECHSNKRARSVRMRAALKKGEVS